MKGKKVRGPYKEYIYNWENTKIPASTLQSRRKAADKERQGIQNHNSQQVQYEPEEMEVDSNEIIKKFNSFPTSSIELHGMVRNVNEVIGISENEVDDREVDKDDKNDKINEDGEDDDDNDDQIDTNEKLDIFFNELGPIEDETSDFSTDEEEECPGDTSNHEKERIAIYPGCNLTEEESEVLIMTYASRHHLSDAALDDLVRLIDCHLPKTLYGSKHCLVKKYDTVPIKMHFYCPTCITVLPSNGKENCNSSLICPQCKAEHKVVHLKRNYNYFLCMSIKDQLQAILNSDLYYKLRTTCEDESDVINSKIYEEKIKERHLKEHCISLNFCFDGVKVSKSSTVSMWPGQAVIQELPYRARRENVILCSLWYGKDKPNMNVFLSLFVDELTELHEKGFTCQTPEGFKTIKVHAILSTVDSVARPLLQNIKQYNGLCGCPFCLHKGERIVMGKGFSRIYRGQPAADRTEDQHYKACEKAEETGKPYQGVKGSSILMLLPLFNIISSFVPDYMHCVLLGVVKTMVNALFDSKNNEKDWYLGRKIDLIDQILQNIKPPSEVTRTPRSLHDRALWKASEWKNFLLYYSLPCFKQYLPEIHFKHWFLLVLSMNIFLKKKIDNTDFLTAESALREYISKVENLYGEGYMKFNMHLMYHIPQSVLYHGALWATSTFPFEHYNGILAKLFRSSQAIPLQICKSYLRLKQIQKAGHVFSTIECSLPGKQLFDRILGNLKTKRCIEYGSFLRVFGLPTDINLSLVQKVCIEVLIKKSVAILAKRYDRFIYKNSLYHSCNYNRNYKRNNSIIRTNDGKFVSIIGIFNVISEEEDYVILGKIYRQVEGMQVCRNGLFSSDKFCQVVELHEEIVALCPNMISSKCVSIPLINNKFCIFPLVNDLERD